MTIRKLLAVLLLLALPAVVHAEWSPTVKLSTDEGSAVLNENMGQTLIADGSTLHVVWCDTKKDGSGIFYKRSTDGGKNWGADTRVSASPSNDAFPLIALSGTTLHLVFLRNPNSPQSASYYKRSTDGGNTWGPDVLLGETKWWPGVAAAGSNVYVSLNTKVSETNSEVFFRRSTDNGATWEAQQQISNAPGRSEDPAIAALGSNVCLVWNDNRDVASGKGMAVYFRSSKDNGASWGPETALTHAPAYTYFPTLSLSGSNIDVAFGDRQTGTYNIYYLHSGDKGATWGKAEAITQGTVPQFYPSIARDGASVDLVWGSGGGVMYRHSGDGGATWDPADTLAGSKTAMNAFVAVSGTAVHVIWTDRQSGHGAIYYKSNPTGNNPAQALVAKSNK